MEYIEDVIHAILVEVKSFQDERIDSVIFAIAHDNFIIFDF